MLFRMLLVIVSGLLLSSCALLNTKPVEKSFEQRMQDFPQDSLPLEGKAEIRWNEFQVPFIKAESDKDCAMLLGMTHAHLRLGQMYLFREVVNHRLAKHAGPLATSIDHTLLTMNLFAAVDSIESNMDTETKLWLTSFVQGINLYQERMNELPLELKALNLQMQDWTLKDIIKIGRLISADVNWFSWFSYLKLQEKPGWDSFWKKLVSSGGGTALSTQAYSQNSQEKILAELLGGMSKSGSNAFVLGADKTKSGSAIMASDPHLGLTLPNMWLIVGYECPSYHVLGLMFPALPMVLVGRNEHISFSGTNMRAASSDLYELSPEQMTQISSTYHTIEVKGWFDKKIKLRKHEIGPIISDAPLFKGSNKTIAMRWVGHSYSDELSATLRMNKAKNWNEFVSSFENYAVSGQNYLYADGNANIGLLPAVKIPIRDYEKPSALVFSATDQSKAWQGHLSSSDLPHIYNPESGFISSANNQPVKANTPLGFFFSSDDRVQRMNSVILSKDKLDFEDIRLLHSDTFVESAQRTKVELLKQMQKLNPDTRPKGFELIYQNLSDWDAHYRADSKAPVIYQILLYYFAKDYYAYKYDKEYVQSLLGSDLLNDIFLHDIQTGDPNVVEKSLLKALRKTYDKQKRFATWGDMHQMELSHNFGRIPLIGKRFRFGSHPVGGTTNSLMKTAHSLNTKKHSSSYGANARFITFMDDENQNYFVLMGGQDGWVGSSGLYDQVAMWRKGEYMRIPLKWTEVEKEFLYRMELKP